MVTLQDVAREAGVAVSTVSRALTQPERISPPTRARVQEVARRLGYRPNRIARAVVSGRTQMLAVLVPDITNPHHFGLIRGAEERARAADRTLVLGDTRGDPGLEADHLDRLGSVVDGIVLASSRLPDADLRELARRRPVVLHNRELPGLPGVVTDFDDGMPADRSRTSPRSGHRRVAYLSGPRRSWSEGRRWAALTAEATPAGVVVQRLGPFAPTSTGARPPPTPAWRPGRPRWSRTTTCSPSACCAASRSAGCRYRGRVSVTGFDDIFGADFCHPPLTTVTAPTEEAGRALVDVLLDGRATRRASRSSCRCGCGCAGRAGPPRATPELLVRAEDVHRQPEQRGGVVPEDRPGRGLVQLQRLDRLHRREVGQLERVVRAHHHVPGADVLHQPAQQRRC